MSSIPRNAHGGLFMNIFHEHGGACGAGTEPAYSMVHKARKPQGIPVS